CSSSQATRRSTQSCFRSTESDNRPRARSTAARCDERIRQSLNRYWPPKKTTRFTELLARASNVRTSKTRKRILSQSAPSSQSKNRKGYFGGAERGTENFPPTATCLRETISIIRCRQIRGPT